MRKPTPEPASSPASLQRRGVGRMRSPFRSRLFAMLLLCAVIPTVVVSAFWTGAASRALSLVTERASWDRLARSGATALDAVRTAPLTDAQRAALAAHETELRQAVELGTRFEFVARRSMRLILVGALVVVLLVALGASRVAGHLSRQLSRPLDELVGWTRLLRSGQPLPTTSSRRGTPEFEVLRSGMRTMADELAAGRQRALEAERAEAFRESARRFAHELKNPLTPIRFAVDRLRRDVPAPLRETVDVLAEESARLEAMARSFAQFGRLPDGPLAGIDLTELVTRTARNTVPERLRLQLDMAPDLPLIAGYHEPLARAVTNVLLNAVDASPADATITVRLRAEGTPPAGRLVLSVVDQGPGIPRDAHDAIFEPYVTTKPGGTGLGLAIARQTIQAHDGTITVDSTAGHGTTFTITLPLPSPDA